MRLFGAVEGDASFFAKVFGRRARLKRARSNLRVILADTSTSLNPPKKALSKYVELIGIAANVGSDAVVATVREFDPAFANAVVGEDPALKHALKVLRAVRSPTRDESETALRLSLLIGDRTLYREALQENCLFFARIGDGNQLLAKLFERQKSGLLSKSEHEAVLTVYLSSRSFDGEPAWSHFFVSFPLSEVPRLHQVFAVLERKLEAAELAEESGAYTNAIRYLLDLSKTDTSLRALSLCEKTSDSELRRACNVSVAECYVKDGKYSEAVSFFREASELDRASDCLLLTGNLAGAIEARPLIGPDWKEKVRTELEETVRSQLGKGEFSAAAKLLRDVQTAWLSRRDGLSWQAEVVPKS